MSTQDKLAKALHALVNRRFTYWKGVMLGADRKITRDEVRAAREALSAHEDDLLARETAASSEAERDRLAACLKKANDQAEEFERKFYLEQQRAEDLAAECEALRGLLPELPPRPPHNNDASFQHPALPRYGLRWNGPGQPVSVPMADGYWTPFHLALAAATNQQAGETIKPADCEKPFFAWDEDNGRQDFATQAEAMAFAQETVGYYRRDARTDGVWPDEVERVIVGVITHVTVRDGNEEDGFDYRLSAPHGICKE